MRKITFLTLTAVMLFGLLLWVNCSKPLETLSGGDLNPTSIETFIDTITIVDTILVIDTVYVTIPDSGAAPYFCSQLSSNRQEIVWMFRNSEGTFHLEFQANVDKVNPAREVVIEIDGVQYLWYPSKDSELTIDCDMTENTSVRISTNTPHTYGHAIDICLNVEVFR